METKKKIDWWMIFGIVILLTALFLLIYISKEMKKDGSKCMTSPFTYGALKLEESTGKEVTGYVVIEKRGSMSFNSTDMIAGERWSYQP